MTNVSSMPDSKAVFPIDAGSLEAVLEGSPFQNYVYAYPHKTAYRPFESPKPLESVWAPERPDTRFLYVHIPFCEMRCGFCNLFTTVNPREHVVEQFLAQLEVEAKATAARVGTARYTRAALGGGTPTYLEPAQLERVVRLMCEVMGLGQVPFSVELSPGTVTKEKLEVLSAATRLSLGVQSFVEAEVAAVKRPQNGLEVRAALDLIRQHSRADLNVDLIYGMEGQTESSFAHSLREATRWQPEEIYLYPLYVRPLTFLGTRGKAWDDHRLTLYRTGRSWLLSHGYRQRSMRVFQRERAEIQLPEYHSEDDGMVGLGVGARSYTKAVHYAHDWAVEARAVRSIIERYLERTPESFGFAHAGFELSVEEQQRRWLLLSLFGDGALEAAFEKRFGLALLDALPSLHQLVTRGLAAREGGRLALTAEGLERSDALGPWLFSESVVRRMGAWEAK